jgi:hypothetical protein
MRAVITAAVVTVVSALLAMCMYQQDINFALMAFALVVLGLLGEVAANEQESFEHAYANHLHDWIVHKSWVTNGNYVHALYEQYKAYGHNNLIAHDLMQKDIKGLEIGELYKPFTAKPTPLTRVLMTKVGGAK